ncbi:hypothetical protein B0H13DRAFT_2319365 [Mycena leptocephala]|nr:hypothetical protein B0H13DRAFT_2319365 [Mycena leptocephala]
MTEPTPESPSPPESPSSPVSASPSVFIPDYPFSEASDADSILRSSDGVDFHVYRAILSLVSPIFRSMFSLPQQADAPKVPVIDVAEDSDILDKALRFFYPGAQPIVDTLDELRCVIEILVSKYDMESVSETAKDHLAKYLPGALSPSTLRLRVHDTVAPPELKHIPAAAYHNLLRYHYLCGVAAKSKTQNLRHIPVPNQYVWFSCTDAACAKDTLSWYLADKQLHPVRLWFIEYLGNLGTILMEAPGTNIGDDKSLHLGYKKAAKCAICREKVFDQLYDFVSKHLASKVEEAIDGVDFSL